ncbi:transcriptional regulator with XRE-family HTH domain [Pedobacter sp. UYP24]
MELIKVGDLVNSRRTMLHLRQEDLSEMSGVNIKTIRQIELGKGNPSYLTLSKIFEILGLTFSVGVKEVS